MLSWRPSGHSSAPVHQVHGERDPLFPASLSRADEIILGAGHLLTMTHGQAVNAFLAAGMRQAT